MRKRLFNVRFTPCWHMDTVRCRGFQGPAIDILLHLRGSPFSVWQTVASASTDVYLEEPRAKESTASILHLPPWRNWKLRAQNLDAGFFPRPYLGLRRLVLLWGAHSCRSLKKMGNLPRCRSLYGAHLSLKMMCCNTWMPLLMADRGKHLKPPVRIKVQSNKHFKSP